MICVCERVSFPFFSFLLKTQASFTATVLDAQQAQMRFFSLKGFAVALPIACILFVCGFLWLVSHSVTRPSFLAVNPAAVEEAAKSILNGIRFLDVSFPAIDNQTLRGWWIPAPSHGQQGTRVLLSQVSCSRLFLLHCLRYHTSQQILPF